jgi:hypothetical protein
MRTFIALVAAAALALTLEHFWKGAHDEAFKINTFPVEWVLLIGLGMAAFFVYKLNRRGSR